MAASILLAFSHLSRAPNPLRIQLGCATFRLSAQLRRLYKFALAAMLAYDATLELLDPHGQTAVLQKRLRGKVPQDYGIAFEDDERNACHSPLSLRMYFAEPYALEHRLKRLSVREPKTRSLRPAGSIPTGRSSARVSA